MMSNGLQSCIISGWSSFPSSSTGAPCFSPVEMVALNYDNLLTRAEVEFYADVFQRMSSGFNQGLNKAQKYKDSLKKGSIGRK